MPSCSEFLRKCWWRGEERNCSDLFDVRKTDDGFCCSFNTLDQVSCDWSAAAATLTSDWSRPRTWTSRWWWRTPTP